MVSDALCGNFIRWHEVKSSSRLERRLPEPPSSSMEQLLLFAGKEYRLPLPEGPSLPSMLGVSDDLRLDGIENLLMTVGGTPPSERLGAPENITMK